MKIKCLQCGQILESKFRHDFKMCDCPNETFIDGGNDYLRYGGMDLSKIEHIIEPNPEMIKASIDAYKKGDYLEIEELLDQIQKRPSSVAKIEAERKNTLKRLKENEN